MELSRLIIDGAGSSAPLEVQFEPTVAVLSVNRPAGTRVRLALENLLQGSTDFGRAMVRVEGVEIEVSPELAKHLALHYGPRSQILDRTVADRTGTGDGDQGDSVAAVTMRAALELLRVVNLQLDRRTVDSALQAVIAERHVLRTDAEMAVVEAANRKAEAQVALSKLDYWRASVGPLHERSVEARKRTRRRLSGPLSYRRYSRIREQEMELLEAGDFESFDDFEAYALDAERHYRSDVEQATAELDEAARYRDALQSDAPGPPEADRLTVGEYVLRLRLRQIGSGGRLSDGERRSLHNALSIMMEIDHGVRVGSEDRLVDEALARLAGVESERLRSDLRRRAASHAEPLPAVGSVPLILDGFLDGVEPSAAGRALEALDPYVGQVQIISLRRDPAIVRWARNHRSGPTPELAPPPPPLGRGDRVGGRLTTIAREPVPPIPPERD